MTATPTFVTTSIPSTLSKSEEQPVTEKKLDEEEANQGDEFKIPDQDVCAQKGTPINSEL